jgi:ABC-2 type transport system ATP-binding protein
MFSTHQMTDVEELCDEIVMIDQGTVVLSGGLASIKRRYAGGAIVVASDPAPDGLPGVESSNRVGDDHTLKLRDGVTPESVLRALLDRGATITRFEVATPSLEEIFLRVVEERRA